jgi:hypothetical protein
MLFHAQITHSNRRRALDLNLAREGLSHYFYSDTGPTPYWAHRLGTMEPSLVLGALLSL